jgi:hypothetical protein
MQAISFIAVPESKPHVRSVFIISPASLLSLDLKNTEASAVGFRSFGEYYSTFTQ